MPLPSAPAVFFAACRLHWPCVLLTSTSPTSDNESDDSELQVIYLLRILLLPPSPPPPLQHAPTLPPQAEKRALAMGGGGGDDAVKVGLDIYDKDALMQVRVWGLGFWGFGFIVGCLWFGV